MPALRFGARDHARSAYPLAEAGGSATRLPTLVRSDSSGGRSPRYRFCVPGRSAAAPPRLANPLDRARRGGAIPPAARRGEEPIDREMPSGECADEGARQLIAPILAEPGFGEDRLPLDCQRSTMKDAGVVAQHVERAEVRLDKYDPKHPRFATVEVEGLRAGEIRIGIGTCDAAPNVRTISMLNSDTHLCTAAPSKKRSPGFFRS